MTAIEWNWFLSVFALGWLILVIGINDYLRKKAKQFRPATGEKLLIAPRSAFSEGDWKDFESRGYATISYNNNSPREPRVEIN